MKIFVDTAMIEEIRKVKEWGILDGITTNPTLLAQTGKPWKEAAAEILKEVPDKPLSLEVIATTSQEMIKELKNLLKWDLMWLLKFPLQLKV